MIKTGLKLILLLFLSICDWSTAHVTYEVDSCETTYENLELFEELNPEMTPMMPKCEASVCVVRNELNLEYESSQNITKTAKTFPDFWPEISAVFNLQYGHKWANTSTIKVNHVCSTMPETSIYLDVIPKYAVAKGKGWYICYKEMCTAHLCERTKEITWQTSVNITTKVPLINDDGSTVVDLKCKSEQPKQIWKISPNKLFNWDVNCDFYGNDIGNHTMGAALDCGDLCLTTRGCARFTWAPEKTPHTGLCWLKTAEGSHVPDRETAGSVCGYVVNGLEQEHDDYEEIMF